MLTKKSAKERSELKRGLIRLSGFLLVVSAVSAVYTLRVARVEVGNKTVALGREMIALSDSAANDDKSEVHKLVLNGQPVYMASTVTNDDVTSVLARYEKHCDENRAHSTDLWQELATNNAKDHKVDASSPGAQMAETGGTLRSGNGAEGTVLCFVRTPDAKPTLREGLATLSESGELNAVGLVRYAYAKKSAKGGAHVLAVWTNEKFNVKEFLPEGDKDVPGFDFPQVPRPADSTRIFSIHMEGAPYGVNVYQAKGASPEKTVAGFDRELAAQGWYALDIDSYPKRNTKALENATGRLYEKDGAVLTLVSKVSEGQTVTALGMAGASPSPELDPKQAKKDSKSE
jgi:hypothetical protein